MAEARPLKLDYSKAHLMPDLRAAGFDLPKSLLKDLRGGYEEVFQRPVSTLLSGVFVSHAICHSPDYSGSWDGMRGYPQK